MARVHYFDMSHAPAEYLALLSARRPLNLYRMLPHAGPAGQGFLKLGGALLRENALDSQLREVAIWGRHTRVSQFEQPVFAWR